MIIRSEPILAALLHKVHTHAQDRSRHLLCPACGVRTRLYRLKDGRRKCSACGKKFNPGRKTDEKRIRQYADLLLCFCLNFTARQASVLTGCHYRLVSAVYDHFRMLLASHNLTPDKVRLLTAVEMRDRDIRTSGFCRRCRHRHACKGRMRGDSHIFGVQILQDGCVFIEPLHDADAAFPLDRPAQDKRGIYSAFAGFVCRGRFHRFTDNESAKDGAEHVWAWMSERLKQHHGIWKRKAGLYLKELEWKYNNRLLTSEAQAMKITEIMPDDFLSSWASKERIRLDLVQKHS